MPGLSQAHPGVVNRVGPSYGEAQDFRLGPDNEGSIVNLQVEYFIRASGGTIERRLEDLEQSFGPLRAA